MHCFPSCIGVPKGWTHFSRIFRIMLNHGSSSHTLLWKIIIKYSLNQVKSWNWMDLNWRLSSSHSSSNQPANPQPSIKVSWDLPFIPQLWPIISSRSSFALAQAPESCGWSASPILPVPSQKRGVASTKKDGDGLKLQIHICCCTSILHIQSAFSHSLYSRFSWSW